MHVRYETLADVDAIHELTSIAFKPMAYSDGTEAEIIRRLRAGGDRSRWVQRAMGCRNG